MPSTMGEGSVDLTNTERGLEHSKVVCAPPHPCHVMPDVRAGKPGNVLPGVKLVTCKALWGQA